MSRFGEPTFSQGAPGKMIRTCMRTTHGVVALTLNISSCVTSAWGLKAGQLMPGRRLKIASSILVTESFNAASRMRVTQSDLYEAPLLFGIRSIALAFRHIFLAEEVPSLAGARNESISGLLSREKVSTSSRRPVI